MGEDDNSLTTDTAVPQAPTDSTGNVAATLAPASETPVADTMTQRSADSDGGIGTQLDKIAALVQTLQDNPKICALLYVLLGIKDADNADATG